MLSLCRLLHLTMSCFETYLKALFKFPKIMNKFDEWIKLEWNWVNQFDCSVNKIVINFFCYFSKKYLITLISMLTSTFLSVDKIADFFRYVTKFYSLWLFFNFIPLNSFFNLFKYESQLFQFLIFAQYTRKKWKYSKTVFFVFVLLLFVGKVFHLFGRVLSPTLLINDESLFLLFLSFIFLFFFRFF